MITSWEAGTRGVRAGAPSATGVTPYTPTNALVAEVSSPPPISRASAPPLAISASSASLTCGAGSASLVRLRA
jgi:hypothetical protein